MAVLETEHIQKRFAQTTAVEPVRLEVTRGGFESLLGPSGCGKTMTHYWRVRIIGGRRVQIEGAR